MPISVFYKKQKKYFRVIIPWFCTTAVTTIIFVMIYASVQFSHRSAANDPQIEVAENLETALLAGANPEAVIPNEVVDVEKSLSVFISVFDEALNPVISTAKLEGEPPVLPRGVFENARAYGENRVTWEPRPGVRSAIVVRHFRNDKVAGFVLVGRSLREVEAREQPLTMMIFVGFVVSLVIIAARYLTKFFTGL